MPEMIGTQQIVVLLRERIQQLEQRLTAIEATLKDHGIMYSCWKAEPEGD